MRPAATTWFLTGATGFLGKVMLEELIRRRAELRVQRVLLLIRPRKAQTAADRFRDDVVPAACFATLPPGWTEYVTVLEGDLARPDLGLASHAALSAVTHVVHSAASIAFDLPAVEAVAANIDATLHLLETARACPRLRRFVYVSTAYVTPHRTDGGPIREELVPLPMPADALLDAIRTGRLRDDAILARSGHPNTYTLTKCLAEHLLVQRHGAVPLSIVRPSIIAASRQFPFPGWIDSLAGFGAFATLLGLGHLRAIVGDPNARLDVVPVDEVTSRLVQAALHDRGGPRIRHAVAGLAGASTMSECWKTVIDWFALHPVARRPVRGFLGTSGLRFRVADLWFHQLPMAIGALRGTDARRQLRKLASKLEQLNSVFPYFTTRSFDFRSSMPLAPSRLGLGYIRTICRGLYRHVLKQNEQEWTLAGARHVGHDGDLRWILGQPRGNFWVRSGAWLVTKALRRTTDRVSIDLVSFARARVAVPDGAAVVLVPSHRSYLDFVLCSYLAFARPDLGIPIPHIAATMEFGRIPLLGRLLRAMHAFYLRRGHGKEDPELTERVRTLISSDETLEFFVEGTRSRTREFLPPKRGLLRCLKATGRPVALLPIAISYDRVPEEQSFAAELRGAPRLPMHLGGLLRWAAAAWRGEIALGRVHLAAGAPVLLDPHSDVPAVAEAVIAELRGAMAVTTFHLRAYTAAFPIPGHDAASLQRLIEASGGRVLDSTLPTPTDMAPLVAATLREHFAERCALVLGHTPSSRITSVSAPRESTPSFA